MPFSVSITINVVWWFDIESITDTCAWLYKLTRGNALKKVNIQVDVDCGCDDGIKSSKVDCDGFRDGRLCFFVFVFARSSPLFLK